MYPPQLSCLLSYDHKCETLTRTGGKCPPFPLSLRIGLFYCIHDFFFFEYTGTLVADQEIKEKEKEIYA